MRFPHSLSARKIVEILHLARERKWSIRQIAGSVDISQPASRFFEERFALLLEREKSARENRCLTRLVQVARFRLAACVEDLNFRAKRGLDHTLVMRLASGEWVQQHTTLLITGRTGTEKTFLACALGYAACCHGCTVRQVRLPRLLSELAVARSDGLYGKLMQTLAKTGLLIVNDWGLAPLGDRERRDLFEVIEDRTGRRATLVTSQLPVDYWHELVGDPTFGDAILDRLVHHAHLISLTGSSLRRLRTDAALTTTDD